MAGGVRLFAKPSSFETRGILLLPLSLTHPVVNIVLSALDKANSSGSSLVDETFTQK